jgi:hypothetical protein
MHPATHKPDTPCPATPPPPAGAHTRSISVATPSTAAGGIMKFAKVRPSCLACKAPLKEARKGHSLCEHCAPKEPEIYSRTLASVNVLEVRACVWEWPCLCWCLCWCGVDVLVTVSWWLCVGDGLLVKGGAGSEGWGMCVPRL